MPVLGYHDEYAAGQRIEVIKSYARRLNQMIRGNEVYAELIAQFGIQMEDRPLQLKAKVLPEPCLKFKNRNASIQNGSWDLKDKKFYRPTDLPSFAVINFSEGSRM